VQPLRGLLRRHNKRLKVLAAEDGIGSIPLLQLLGSFVQNIQRWLESIDSNLAVTRP
jgi:hypothetical protein